ncbi:MAG TPA: DNA-binding protein [Cyanobacteria bacterium UBA8553]|nr:DNA-binding protein [Cyanobacteria bacterium UBA8553]HAJ58106.1 DNA-binding protein [Cyanobacteria bacterium UBA8543]
MSKDTKSVIDEFHQVVNMTPKELESWLNTDESQEVGQKDGDDEAIGHKSGRRIVELLQNKKADYSDDDLSHMKKVISYVHRHSAQKPSSNIENSRWRYSLKNWGHDPLK